MNRKIDATTPASLLFRLRYHSDSVAWIEFVDVYSPLIYDYGRSCGLQSSDAADVSQEVLLRVAKAIRAFEYDREKGLFRDWLARIVLNEVRRFIKKQANLPLPAEELDRSPGTLESAWNEHFQQYLFAKALERCQCHFTRETWAIFQRSWIEKNPPDQVADSLGVSVEQIYVARSRVLKRLRHEVAILADDIL